LKSALQRVASLGRSHLATHLATCLALTALNLSISWRLMKVEYTGHFISVGGYFIAIAIVFAKVANPAGVVGRTPRPARDALVGLPVAYRMPMSLFPAAGRPGPEDTPTEGSAPPGRNHLRLPCLLQFHLHVP
jgi:hypothetical protein